MAIKKAVKPTQNNEEKKGIKSIPEASYDDIPDFDDMEDLLPATPNSNHKLEGNAKVSDAVATVQPQTISFQAAALAEADKHPCYGNLVNPAPEAVHWHARQVQAELKVVLRGFSNRNKWWTEERASRLIQQPCGLQENGYILCWVVDPDDFDSYLFLEDIREHMKYAFGDRFIVRPVSELSEDAKGWKFILGT